MLLILMDSQYLSGILIKNQGLIPFI